MADTFVKTKRSGDNLLGEAAGLHWLAEAEPSGGARIVRVLHADANELVLERVRESTPTVAAARAFGRALAHTHAAGAPWWGSGPDGWVGPAWVGDSHTPLILDRNAAVASWGVFYADQRIDVFAKRLLQQGDIDTNEYGVFDRLCNRLRDGEYDVEQPTLVCRAGHAVSRNHGDLWGGNVLYDGGPTGVTLIDSHAQGGHAETDLAALAVFGLPLREEVVAAYHEASPLASGWQDRVELHELAMVINHAFKFGGGYINASLNIARKYC